MDIIKRLKAIEQAWQRGELGGETMPEDARPDYARDDERLYLYLTLPMALNYQRNSYKLWEGALLTAQDSSTAWVFDPAEVCARSEEDLRQALVKYKVALQPNKHVAVWRTICQSLVQHADGSVKKLIGKTGTSIAAIRQFIIQHKKDFPILGGPKVGNYWPYVLHQYTDVNWPDLHNLTVVVDTHVIQASAKLGLIAQGENSPDLVAQRWAAILVPAGIAPINIHTPLWLWSRAGFPEIK